MAEKETTTTLDWLKWLVAVVLAGVGVWGNIFYAEQPFLYRMLALVAIVGIVAYILLQTAHGLAFITLLQGTRSEIRKVVWPTRQETAQTTLIVLLVVAVIAVILWLLDSVFSWVIGLLVS